MIKNNNKIQAIILNSGLLIVTKAKNIPTNHCLPTGHLKNKIKFGVRLADWLHLKNNTVTRPSHLPCIKADKVFGKCAHRARMAKSNALKQVCDDQSSLSSYSDLFEEFFKTDAQAPMEATTSTATYLYPTEQPAAALYVDPYQQQMLAYYYAQQQQQQQQHQPPQPQLQMNVQPQRQQLPVLQPAHPQPHHAYPHHQSHPMMAAISKPGFVRRPPRKQTKSKNYTAHAAQANHLTSIQTATEYAHDVSHYSQTIHQQQHINAQTQMISPKSNGSSQPTSPFSTRSAGTSDFVKHKLQQKIRARMIEKGQIPPNPTQDELRRCGVPPSPMNSMQPSFANSPKQNLAAVVAATVTAPPQQAPNMNMFFNDAWMAQSLPMMPQDQSERDPFVQVSMAPMNQKFNAHETTVNYDDFFSDFIQY